MFFKGHELGVWKKTTRFITKKIRKKQTPKKTFIQSHIIRSQILMFWKKVTKKELFFLWLKAKKKTHCKVTNPSLRNWINQCNSTEFIAHFWLIFCVCTVGVLLNRDGRNLADCQQAIQMFSWITLHSITNLIVTWTWFTFKTEKIVNKVLQRHRRKSNFSNNVIWNHIKSLEKCDVGQTNRVGEGMF